MIQSIREHLKLSRTDMASYLGISSHMVKSIELGRRQIPSDSKDAVAALRRAILDDKAHGLVIDATSATREQIRRAKRLHSKCSRRLNKYTWQLEKMQEAYATALKNLGFYQRFSASLAPARTASDRVRVKWLDWKIAVLTERVRENNPTAQEILSIEIAGLQVRMKRLEGVGQKT